LNKVKTAGKEDLMAEPEHLTLPDPDLTLTPN